MTLWSRKSQEFQCLDGHSVPGLIDRQTLDNLRASVHSGSFNALTVIQSRDMKANLQWRAMRVFQCLDGHSVPGPGKRKLYVFIIATTGFNALTVIQSRDSGHT
jgi:hypothetical protein